MELENGVQDDFSTQTDDATLESTTQTETEPEYLVAYGEGDSEVKLTGEQIVERLQKAMELEGKYAQLEQKLQAVPQQTVQPQVQPQPAPQQTTDPVLQIRATAQDALTRLIQGDETSIPVLLDAIGQFSQMQAQQTTTSTVQQQQAEQRFLADHPDFTEAAQSGKVRNFLAQNPQYGPIEGYLAMKLQDREAAHAAEIAALKAQVGTATAAGKKAGAQETIQAAKAAGGFRVLTGGGAGGNRGSNNGPAVKPGASLEEITSAMQAGLAKIRGVTSLD